MLLNSGAIAWPVQIALLLHSKIHYLVQSIVK